MSFLTSSANSTFCSKARSSSSTVTVRQSSNSSVVFTFCLLQTDEGSVRAYGQTALNHPASSGTRSNFQPPFGPQALRRVKFCFNPTHQSPPALKPTNICALLTLLNVDCFRSERAKSFIRSQAKAKRSIADSCCSSFISNYRIVPS